MNAAGAFVRLLDRGRQLFGTVHAAVAELAFDVAVPAVGKDVVTGEIHDGITAVDFVLPVAGCRWIARNDSKRPHLTPAPNGVGVARKDDGFMTVIEKCIRQAKADQP